MNDHKGGSVRRYVVGCVLSLLLFCGAPPSTAQITTDDLRALDLADLIERIRKLEEQTTELQQKLEEQTAKLEQEPDTMFGAWERVVVGQVYRAESDGFLLAYSGGRAPSGGSIGRVWLQTGGSARSLPSRSRGGQYEGAMIPVKNGNYYRVLMRSGSMETVVAFWLPVAR